MKRLQWTVEVRVHAPVEKVWEAVEDLTLIPQYHPEVRSVECLSGQTRRAPGVTNKCVIPEGRKGWCVESRAHWQPCSDPYQFLGKDLGVGWR